MIANAQAAQLTLCFLAVVITENFKEHFEAKHPKDTLPTEEQAKAFAA